MMLNIFALILSLLITGFAVGILYCSLEEGYGGKWLYFILAIITFAITLINLNIIFQD